MSDTATMGDTTAAATVTTPTAGGTWMPLSMAAELQAVSVRTLQRKIAAGQLHGRTVQGGRREVFILRHSASVTTSHVRPADDIEAVIRGDDNATGTGGTDATGGILAIVAQQAIEQAQKRVEQLSSQVELATIERRQAQRAAFWVTAAAGIVVAVVTAWGIRAVDAAKSRAAAADARAAGLERQAAADQQWRQFVDRLDQ